MDDTETSTDSRSNASEFTVSEISGALKRTVEDAFGNVRVRGEISGYRGQHSSGHAYFALKDERARLEAVIWKGSFARLRFRPEEGMEVIAQGRLTTYPGSSKYQIVIDQLEPAGAGALMALLEERKRRLAAEGLFDDARKRRLPYMPRVIGVVTSPTGAVIRDIIHRVAARFPLHLIVWPVRVQGETTGAEVSAAIAGFNAIAADASLPRPDVLIVARGGGSLEDLWGFNDEVVVRAVAASRIPVISAVGHETDWTLIDLVADRRAPTPTGAAEMAIPVRAELEAVIAGLSARLTGSIGRSGDRKRQALRAAARGLPSPDQLLGLVRRRFDELSSRLERALEISAARKRDRLEALRLSPATLRRRIDEAGRNLSRASAVLPRSIDAGMSERHTALGRASTRLTPAHLLRRSDEMRARVTMAASRAQRATDLRISRSSDRLAGSLRLLSTLSYQATLERGFALVLDDAGAPVKRAALLKPGMSLTLRFADAEAGVTVSGGEEPPAAGRPRTKPLPAPAGRQGSLF